MTNQHNTDIDIILDYLYGDMAPSEKLLFEERLKTDTDFQHLYQQNHRFDQLVKPGHSTKISDQRMAAVNYSLARKLHKQQQGESSLLNGLTIIWQSKVSFKAQIASMAITFLLGAFLFQSSAPISAINQNHSEQSQQSQALRFIQNGDYQITGLDLAPMDKAGKKVKVTYSLSSKTQFEESLDSTNLQQLLAATLKSDVSDSTRLDMVNALTGYVNSSIVTDVFGYSLLNDPNPGVRLAALKSLTHLTKNQKVRAILVKALENDINTGVRVIAFNALNSYADDPIVLAALKSHSIHDSNVYIRTSSKSIIQKQLVQQAPQT